MLRYLLTSFLLIITIVCSAQTLTVADGALLFDGNAIKRAGITFADEWFLQPIDTLTMGIDTLEKYNIKLVRINLNSTTPSTKLDKLISLLKERQFTIVLSLSDSTDVLMQLKTMALREILQSDISFLYSDVVEMWQIPIAAPSAAEAVNLAKHFKKQPLVALSFNSSNSERLPAEVMKMNPDAIVIDINPLHEHWLNVENERKALPAVFLKLTNLIDKAARVAQDNAIPLNINLEGFPRDAGFKKPNSDYYSRLGLWNYLNSKLNEVPQLWTVTIGEWYGAGNPTPKTTTNVIYASDRDLLLQMNQ